MPRQLFKVGADGARAATRDLYMHGQELSLTLHARRQPERGQRGLTELFGDGSGRRSIDIPSSGTCGLLAAYARAVTGHTCPACGWAAAQPPPPSITAGEESCELWHDAATLALHSSWWVGLPPPPPLRRRITDVATLSTYEEAPRHAFPCPDA